LLWIDESFAAVIADSIFADPDLRPVVLRGTVGGDAGDPKQGQLDDACGDAATRLPEVCPSPRAEPCLVGELPAAEPKIGSTASLEHTLRRFSLR